MGSKEVRRRKPRTRTIESLEERQVMSAEPIGQVLGEAISQHSLAGQPIEQHGTLDQAASEQQALSGAILEQHGGSASEMPALVQHSERTADFWIDPAAERDLNWLVGDIEQTLASAHNASGLTQVRNNYGFTGTGQTVAVIDSGIAWDHFALGGGLGPNYRVVGGWDFTEEFDANPYDDGPAGSHGTHVSGIIGADTTGTVNDGVAPGVDLVGLRVFNDAGDGYFTWVEDALKWVHQNRNAFENPITSVNLSIGTTWNSNSVPLWSMLEDEFAQLKSDGIFITVSAGNDFTTYNTTGLSYPAASPYVVPVMSVDDGGNLSYFSQRHTRAIAAPGRFIVSTIPDYTGNHNGATDDFASYSGTSMAAPYVAGASVLLRQAMQFVGYTNITQDTIYNHMMSTADSLFDAATGQTFKRLNLVSAFNALMPSDDYGSTSATAYNLGALGGTRSIAGLIGTLNDKDFFTFTASATGKVRLNVDATHDLDPFVTVIGSSAVRAGDTWTFDVVAGQSYTLSLETSAGRGIGYYDAELSIEQAVPQPLITLKTIVRGDGAVFSLDSENWLSVNGSRIWNCTYDFTLGTDGTLHWQSTYGLLQHRLANGTWVTLDVDCTKFAVDNAGTVYSLGADGWLSVNGSNIWQKTRDFTLAKDQTIYWQCTTGLLQHRLSNGTWQDIDYNSIKFAVRDNGLVYSLGSDGWLKINGSRTWNMTQDFIFTADQSLYWHSTYGLLQHLPNQGSWKTLGNSVDKFAVGHDKAVYSLTDDGRVLVNGALKWSNIADLRGQSSGALLLERADGTTFTVAGHFQVGGSVMTPNALVASPSVQTAGSVAASVSVDFAASSFDAHHGQLLAGTNHNRSESVLTQRVTTLAGQATKQASGQQNGNNDMSAAWERFSSTDYAALDESVDGVIAAIGDAVSEESTAGILDSVDALFTRIGKS